MKKMLALSEEAICVVLLFIFILIYLLVSFFLVFITNRENVDFSSLNYVSAVVSNPVIVIDPGHGGVDGGAVSEDGICEKDINLGIAKYLYDYCQLSGIECILTRDTDTMLTAKSNTSSSRKRSDLIARCEIASENPEYVFISIHQNKFPSSKYSGLQVFYSKNNDGSRILAGIIQENNSKLLDETNKREIKMAGREIYVLDALYEPSVLVECGFLSNALEKEKLKTEKYRKELAFMIYISIMQYMFSNRI